MTFSPARYTIKLTAKNVTADLHLALVVCQPKNALVRAGEKGKGKG